MIRTRWFAVYVRPKSWWVGFRRRYSYPVLPTLEQVQASELEQALGVAHPVPEVRPARLVHVEIHLGPVEVRILRG